MDNIFDILIFLIIIYGLLSPFFKKKKQQDEGLDQDIFFPKPQKQPAEKREYSKYSGQDVLDEIENLFRRETAPKTEPETSVSYDEVHYTPERTHEEKYSGVEKNVSSVFRQPKVIPPLVEVKIPDRPVLVNESALRVRSIIKNPSTFRDGVIISEILNRRKPRFR